MYSSVNVNSILYGVVMMDSKNFIINVLTNKVDMEDYSKRITESPNGFKVGIKRDIVRKGCTVFVSHPFLNDVQCILRYGRTNNTDKLSLAFSGIVDSEMVDILMKKVNCIFPNIANSKNKASVIIIRVKINHSTLILSDVILSLSKGNIFYHRKNNLVAHHRLYNKFINLLWALEFFSRSEHRILHADLNRKKVFESIPYVKKSMEEQIDECIRIFFANTKIYNQFTINLKSRLINGDYSSFVYLVV